MKYDTFRYEKDLILNAALKTIDIGQPTTIPTIAYYSGLTEHTVRNVSVSIDKVLKDLAAHVATMLDNKLAPALHPENANSFEVCFKDAWRILFDFYSANPRAVSFVEQANKLGISEISMIGSVYKFFDRNAHKLSGKMSPELLARLFHSSALSTAKSALQHDSATSKMESSLMGEVLWSGLHSAGVVND